MPINKIIALQTLSALLGLFIWAAPRLLSAKLGLPSDTDQISILLLPILGLVMGYCFPTVKPWMWGVSAVILFPVFSLYEAEASLNPHNLLPFEFIFTYPYLAAFVIVGACIGRWIRNKISTKGGGVSP